MLKETECINNLCGLSIETLREINILGTNFRKKMILICIYRNAMLVDGANLTFFVVARNKHVAKCSEVMF